MLKFMVFYLDYSLQNRRIIFRIRINFLLYALICLGFIHITLNVYNFLENTVNILFSVFYRIKVKMRFPEPTISKIITLIKFLQAFDSLF
jgi:hypothetical protein